MTLLELAMAGWLSCTLVKNITVDYDRMCFYQCRDTSKEFAKTLKQYQCPKTLYVDRPALPFKKRDYKGNRWTEKEIESFKE